MQTSLAAFVQQFKTTLITTYSFEILKSASHILLKIHRFTIILHQHCHTNSYIKSLLIFTYSIHNWMYKLYCWSQSSQFCIIKKESVFTWRRFFCLPCSQWLESLIDYPGKCKAKLKHGRSLHLWDWCQTYFVVFQWNRTLPLQWLVKSHRKESSTWAIFFYFHRIAGTFQVLLLEFISNFMYLVSLNDLGSFNLIFFQIFAQYGSTCQSILIFSLS